MNAFRVTILILLVAIVGLMFYVLTVYIPEQRKEYSVYEAMRSQSESDARAAADRRNLANNSPVSESPEEESARREVEQSAAALERQRLEADERSALEAGRRKEEAARKRAEAAETAQSKLVGAVASFDEEWNFLRIQVSGDKLPDKDAKVLIVRDGRAVCEAVITGADETPGFVIADPKIMQPAQGDVNIDPASLKPRAGDGVIPSDLIDIGDTSADPFFNSNAAPLPPTTGSSAPEEIEGVLIPVAP